MRRAGMDSQERTPGTRRLQADPTACSPATLLLSRDGSRACTQVTPRGTSSVSTARSPGTRGSSPGSTARSPVTPPSSRNGPAACSPGTRRGSSSGSTARSPVTPPSSRSGPAVCTPASMGETGSSTASSPATLRGAVAADRVAESSKARSPACTPATRSADWASPSGASSPGTTGGGGADRRTPRMRGPAPSAQRNGAGRREKSRRR
ncbi:hypothetical protein SETIT_9G410400v2 [Setaria italica]|uniref:Uncharacterized protein n=1 Tax=Setaria italica TaxID=4555 RepID=A0A368SR43_SETIT|nr:hypothetical protein SETIT_9G410400v2 [Setaria italica]